MVSHERILWSIDGRCCLLCVGWQVRGVGGSVRAVRPIDVYRNSLFDERAIEPFSLSGITNMIYIGLAYSLFLFSPSGH